MGADRGAGCEAAGVVRLRGGRQTQAHGAQEPQGFVAKHSFTRCRGASGVVSEQALVCQQCFGDAHKEEPGAARACNRA